MTLDGSQHLDVWAELERKVFLFSGDTHSNRHNKRPAGSLAVDEQLPFYTHSTGYVGPDAGDDDHYRGIHRGDKALGVLNGNDCVLQIGSANLEHQRIGAGIAQGQCEAVAEALW